MSVRRPIHHGYKFEGLGAVDCYLDSGTQPNANPGSGPLDPFHFVAHWARFATSSHSVPPVVVTSAE